jgi:hypothetical protein
MGSMFFCANINAVPQKLNEWGDFFAGFFAPVAFLWLVLGYLQQGQELQLSTKALELQAEELRSSVDQQRQLVELTRKQVDAEREALKEERQLRRNAAKPKFILSNSGLSVANGVVRYNSYIENVGNTATELTFEFEPKIKYATLTTMTSFARGLRVPFEFMYTSSQAEPGAYLIIRYFDADGSIGESFFELIVVPPTPGETHSMVKFKQPGR